MATDAAITTAAPQDEIFHTCFLRDGTSNKSFAIVHFNPAVSSVEYQIYERNASSPVGSESINGSASNSSADAGPTFTFAVTKQSTYFVIARVTASNGNGETVTKTLHWSMDPNKRRVVSASSKKRTAAEAASTEGAAPAAAAAPETAAAVPAKAGKDEKAEAKPESGKEEKAKKSKATAPEDGEKAKKKSTSTKPTATPIAVA